MFTVTLGCNQVVTALGFNMLGLGLASTLNKYLFGISVDLAHAPNMPLWFGQNIFFYIAFISVPVSYVIFKYTKWGLKLRAIGEYPRAADTVGVRVYLNRYITCMISGVFACLGGASMTIGGLGYFQDNMIAGRGFIAFAAVIFGRYSPIGALIACLIFGFADALQLRMQSLGFSAPYHLFIMMPYVVTIVLLVLFGGKAFIPKAQGTPYVKDER